jgi:hypothetical protein
MNVPPPMATKRLVSHTASIGKTCQKAPVAGVQRVSAMFLNDCPIYKQNPDIGSRTHTNNIRRCQITKHAEYSQSVNWTSAVLVRKAAKAGTQQNG